MIKNVKSQDLPPGCNSNNSARVLLLTPESFNKVTGGGITLTNLFAGWPIDKIATIHRDCLQPANDVCNHYYNLTDNEIHHWGVIRNFIPKISSKIVKFHSRKLNGRRWVISAIKFIKIMIFGDSIPKQVHLTPELCAWVDEFHPTVLYTTLGSNAMMEMAERLRVQFGLPLVIHIMDDWVSVVYRGGLLSHWQRKKKDRLFQHLVDISTARIAICEEMAEAYLRRYGKPFTSFQNTIDVNMWRDFIKDPCIVSSPPRVAYIGSIFPYAQLNSLIDCCNAIQQMNEEGFPISLEIYSPGHLAEQYRKQLLVGMAISLRDTISDDRTFFETLQAVDILILPVNFDSYTVKFIRYSMPTKIPAYLTAGTPILAYGPSGIAQISYAHKGGWGLTIEVRDCEMLKQAFRQLATDISLRERLSSCARSSAAQRHDANIVRYGFQSVLENSSNLTKEI